MTASSMVFIFRSFRRLQAGILPSESEINGAFLAAKLKEGINIIFSIKEPHLENAQGLTLCASV